MWRSPREFATAFISGSSSHRRLTRVWNRVGLRFSGIQTKKKSITGKFLTALSAVSPLYRPIDTRTSKRIRILFLCSRMYLIGSGNEINCGVIGMKFSIENFFYRGPLDVILNICLFFLLFFIGRKRRVTDERCNVEINN